MKKSAVSRRKGRTATVPKAAEGLSPEARRWCKKIRADYDIDDSAGLLVLQTAAEQFDAMRAAERIVARDGPVIRDRFGQKKQHPATLVARDARMGMLRCIRQLGLDLEPLHGRPGRPSGV